MRVLKRQAVVRCLMRCIVSCLAWACASGAQSVWQPISPLPREKALLSVTYDGGLFVAAGDSGTVVTSPDGLQWVVRSTGTAAWLAEVTHGGSQFVAVGFSGAIITSPNGADWVVRNSGFSEFITSVAYGDSRFIALGWTSGAGNQWILSSPDGVAWNTVASVVFEEQLNGLTHGGGRFVGVGNCIIVLPDGGTWDVPLDPEDTDASLTSVAYGNGRYVAVGFAGQVRTSPDGSTWSRPSSGISRNLHGVTFGNNRFVAFGDSGAIFVSVDGTVWSPVSSGTALKLSSGTFGDGRFVAVGENGVIVTSPADPDAARPQSAVARSRMSRQSASYAGGILLVPVSPPAGHGTASLRMCAVSGETVFTGTVPVRGTTLLVQAGAVPAGIYVVSVSYGDGREPCRPVVVKE